MTLGLIAAEAVLFWYIVCLLIFDPVAAAVLILIAAWAYSFISMLTAVFFNS